MPTCDHDTLKRELVWVPVAEAMPDDEMTVLVASDAGEPDISLAWHADGEWRDCGTAEIIGHVSHWMHLPEHPMDGGNQ
jgi:hypothetical protein